MEKVMNKIMKRVGAVCISILMLFTLCIPCFADEPTGNLDSDTAGEIIDILKARAKERNKCVIVVTHSKEVADAADVVYELKDKKLKKRGK